MLIMVRGLRQYYGNSLARLNFIGSVILEIIIIYKYSLVSVTVYMLAKNLSNKS